MDRSNPDEIATRIVNEWSNEAIGLPLPLALAKLGITIASEIEAALDEQRERLEDDFQHELREADEKRDL